MAFGRPSKYDPKYCDMLIEHMASGLSYQSFAAVVDVNIDTLYEWERNNQAFSDAKKEGFTKNLLWWEKAGNQGLWGTKEASFNSAVWIFNMKNRHKWRDRIDIEHEDKQLAEREKLKRMSMSELTELVKTKLLEESSES